MSVLIRGMEMPTEGEWISVNIFPEGKCVVQSWCGKDFICAEKLTAIPVPEHGKLIDADTLKNTVLKALNDAIAGGSSTFWGRALCTVIAKSIVDEIEAAPIVIPADKEV